MIGLVLGCRRPLATLTVREEPWDDPAWRDLLERERAGQGLPEVPVYLYHADQDAIVPPVLARDLARAYRDRGIDVTTVAVEAPDHLSGAHLGAAGAVAWLARWLAQFDRRKPSPTRTSPIPPTGAWDAGLAGRRRAAFGETA